MLTAGDGYDMHAGANQTIEASRPALENGRTSTS